MGDSNQDPRLQNQQYYQNAQQVPQNVFQQQQWAQVNGQGQYGYPNQQYGYNDQYQQQHQQQYYEEGDYEDDYDNLEAIDRELNQSGDYPETEEDKFAAQVEKEIESQAYQPRDVGATPLVNGQLSQHAADFWFPECRNCTCCNGFKHGCACCKRGNGVHTCTDPNCVDKEFSQQVNTNLASRAPTEKAATPAAAPSAYKVSSPPAASAAPSEVCRFESGPGGCRFGASCRFKHNFPPSASSGYAAPVASGPPGSKPRCTFFVKGTCTNGDNCRFGHY